MKFTTMIKTEKNSLEITRRMPDSTMEWRVFNHKHNSQIITNHADRFHMPNFETQSFILDWQLMVDDNFDVEILWY